MPCDPSKVPILECEVVFLSPEEGGRGAPPRQLSSNGYRPHFVLGSREQRSAIRSGSRFTETYYGVIFCEGPDEAQADIPYRVKVWLPFYPVERYSGFNENATFTIREGWIKIVGHGRVLSRRDSIEMSTANEPTHR